MMSVSRLKDAVKRRYLRYKAEDKNAEDERVQELESANVIAASMPKDIGVPRYLRYKAEDKNADDYWDEELERANSILHNRVIRMERDKLCVDCARFDWLRTHFYTREAKRSGGRDLEKDDLKIGDEFQGRRFWIRLNTVALHGIEDDVQWLAFEIVLGVKDVAKQLAEHPRFVWTIQISECSLCSAIYSYASTMIQQSWPAGLQRELKVTLRRGCFLEEGRDHRCCSWYSSELSRSWINALKVSIKWGHETMGQVEHEFPIRPVLSPERGVHDCMPHCCMLRWDLQPMVNFDLMVRWLKQCDEKHKHESGLLPYDRELDEIRFIDVQNQCIIQRKHLERYAALSYTWGSRKQYCLTRKNIVDLEKKGSLANRSKALGPTVMDSMQVCRSLNISYLWIDALCIVQDDAESKHAQIKNMDYIYANAYITLVAAAEQIIESQEEHSILPTGPGLPRVSTPGPCKMAGFKFSLDGVHYACSGAEGAAEVLSRLMRYSSWNSRGWTLQELALSSRVLCFTGEQALFCCPQGIIAESFSLGENRFRSLPLFPGESMKICGLLHWTDDSENPRTIEAIVQRFDTVFLPLLREYCGRNLTFESDRLYAFLGIINAETRILGSFHWGLPTALFVRALFLHQSIDPQVNYRSDYPSWSWLSWTLPFGGSIFNIHIFLRPLVHMYICNEQAELQLLFGPRDDQTGVEGYCPEAINSYNICINTEPLPVLPCIDGIPSLAASARNIFGILIFWSHVARIDANRLYVAKAIPKWCYKHGDGMCDVALLATGSWETSTVELERSKCLVIIIQRNRGFARVIGHKIDLDFEVWKQGNPKLELLLLA